MKMTRHQRDELSPLQDITQMLVWIIFVETLILLAGVVLVGIGRVV